MHKKGQAAMEFLMTYGWAILVVLIAIGALAYFGVLSPERFLPEKCVISTGSGLYCDDYSASGTTVTLRIKNILTDTITVSGITLDVTGETCDALNITQDVSADSTYDFGITCGTLVSGDKIKGDISISFAKVGGLSKTAAGQLVTTSS